MFESESDSSSVREQFFEIISKGAKLAEIYMDLYLCGQSTRTTIQSGMGWLQETLRTPGECHKML
jgi:hypothetical protein